VCVAAIIDEKKNSCMKHLRVLPVGTPCSSLFLADYRFGKVDSRLRNCSYTRLRIFSKERNIHKEVKHSLKQGWSMPKSDTAPPRREKMHLLGRW
jgi:hypothetical protein